MSNVKVDSNIKIQITEMVEDNRYISTKESDFYRQKILEMLDDTYDTKFLRQVYTIIRKHKEKA